jgi:hypothetical protein
MAGEPPVVLWLPRDAHGEVSLAEALRHHRIYCCPMDPLGAFAMLYQQLHAQLGPRFWQSQSQVLLLARSFADQGAQVGPIADGLVAVDAQDQAGIGHDLHDAWDRLIANLEEERDRLRAMPIRTRYENERLRALQSLPVIVDPWGPR